MNQFYRSGKACVKRFIRRRLNKSDDKKAAVSGGAQRPQGNIIRSGKSSRPVVIYSLRLPISMIWRSVRDANTLYAAIENTNSIVVFDLGQKKILHTFTAPIAKEKSVKHCGGCKDQGRQVAGAKPG